MSLYTPHRGIGAVDMGQCRVEVYHSIGGLAQCARKPVVVVEDIGYCRQHAPEGTLKISTETLYSAHIAEGRVRVATTRALPTPKGWTLTSSGDAFGHARRLFREDVGKAIGRSRKYLGLTADEAVSALRVALSRRVTSLRTQLESDTNDLKAVEYHLQRVGAEGASPAGPTSED